MADAIAPGMLAPAATADDYLPFAARLTAGGILSDPWLDGKPRFSPEPHRLSRAQHQALYGAAEAVAAVYDRAVALCHQDPSLVERYFDLTPWQRRMWQSAAPFWHGIARADVFLTESGVAVCELNCDTPSGEAETVLLNRAAHRDHAVLHDPNTVLERRFCRLVERVAGRPLSHRLGGLSVGIVYPSELPEDLSMVVLYRRWLESRGARVTLGSPYNLTPHRRGVALLGEPCQLLIRHYKTDWWGERSTVRDDQPPFADARPLERQLGHLLRPDAPALPAVINPFAAVLPQNKRIMALLWGELGRFPSWAQEAIRRHVPCTALLERLPRAQLLVEKNDWVLKSDYGCEGAEVVLGAEVSPGEWQDALVHARPRRWIAQRRFHPLTDERGASANYGVFLVAGVASGIFTRVQRGSTGRGALTVPTLVEGP